MIKGKGLIDEWIEEAEDRGEARGEAKASRKSLLNLLESRFGKVPARVMKRIEKAEASWCQAMIIRAATAPSLEDLELE